MVEAVKIVTHKRVGCMMKKYSDRCRHYWQPSLPLLDTLCFSCHRHHQERPVLFMEWMIRHMGRARYEALERRHELSRTTPSGG